MHRSRTTTISLVELDEDELLLDEDELLLDEDELLLDGELLGHCER